MTTPRRANNAELPMAARLLVCGTGVAAMALAALVTVRHPTIESWLAVGALAAVFAAVDLFKIDLPYRRGGLARFSLTDAVMIASLLLVDPATVILGVIAGLLLSSAVERVEPIKAAFNVAQYVAGAGAAVLLYTALHPEPVRQLGPATVGALAAAATLFLLVNTVTVAGIIALSSGAPVAATVRRMTRTAALMGVGNICMAVLAVLVYDTSPWALPTLAVPLGLLHAASAQAVRARVDRERSQAFVEVEQRLGDGNGPDEIFRTLSDGVRTILGCEAAVWHAGTWVGDVPAGSGPCPVAADLMTPLRTRGPVLGPAVEGECAAVGLGDAVLVAWPGELKVDGEAASWLERLAASGRVHTARSRAAAELRQERATLRAVVDGTADGILVVDPGGTIQLWNPAMATLAQVPADAAVGQAVADVLGDGPWSRPGVHDVLLGGGDDDADAAANQRVWRVSVSDVRDGAQGELLVAVVHDVTTERRVARMKDDMLSIVSHELRTPLTPIKGSAQLLRRRWERMPEDMRNELLTSIEQRADHLTRLVEDLLLVGQLSASSGASLRVQPGPVDLAALARETVAQQKSTHPGHDLIVRAPAELGLVTDPLRVRQILDNLVNNACKFAPEGTAVTVSVSVDDDAAVVSVSDEGRGIPAEDLDRVFERFERVEDPLHMQTGGAGLGLYIVRALAHAMGGTVRLSSTLGEGTTVVLTLPLPARSADAAPPEPALQGHRCP